MATAPCFTTRLRDARPGVGIGSFDFGINFTLDENARYTFKNFSVPFTLEYKDEIYANENFTTETRRWEPTLDLSGYTRAADAFKGLCVHARHAKQLPLQATTSMAACPMKRGKKGVDCESLRVLHCTCAW